MKDELRQALSEIAAHPASYGVGAAVARWWLGDREGGWRALCTYVICAVLVAWGGELYLRGEGYTPDRKGFYLLLLAFVAKDLLTALASIAGQFRVDPFGVLRRVKEAISGGPK